MARQERRKSENELYHVVLRGVNQQQIFYCDEDDDKFIDILNECRVISGFGIYAYCLMGNHAHILIHAKDEPLDRVMQRIETRYAVWFNQKYDRSGHLFQDRFKSKAVNNDEYFMTALRYILNNPVKAGFCTSPEQYKYSSAYEYFSGIQTGFTDVAYANDLIGRESLLAFLSAESADEDIDEVPKRAADSEAERIICEITGEDSSLRCGEYGKAKLKKVVPEFRNRGLSLRQISRLTGLSVGVIRGC